MINVTDEAKGLLKEILTQAEEESGLEDEEVAIRLAQTVPEGSDTAQVELGLVLDAPREGDQVVEHDGKAVLLVDESVVNMLDGATLDATDTPEGPRLTMNR